MNKNCTYTSHREFFNDLMEATRNGFNPDKMKGRAIRCFNAVGSDEARTSSQKDGGFIIPTELLPNVMSVNFDGTQLNTGTLVQRLPMKTNLMFVPARVDKAHATNAAGGFKVSRREETGLIESSIGEYEQIRLEARSLMGMSFATNELMMSSDITSVLLSRGYDLAYLGKLNQERIWGSGVGEFLGFMNSGCLITVNKDLNQTTKTITNSNVRSMAARCWGFSKAVWMVNQDCLEQIAALSDFDNKTFTLLSRPIFLDENMSTLGTLGDIALTNWGEYLEGQIGGIDFNESIHCRFEENENAFRFTAYNDGCPWWRSPLTAKNSAATLSPFVTLAAR